VSNEKKKGCEKPKEEVRGKKKGGSALREQKREKRGKGLVSQ